MRRHAKATTAGSTKRLGKSKPALLACVLAASVAVLALVVGSASGATTRFLVETFGSSAQPAFPADRGMAYDQGSEELYVIDSTENTLRRFNADGSASNFSALGSNAIDGAGAEDETPQEGLSFSSNDEREQIAIDESGEATDGNLYLTQSGSDVVDIFSPAGEYLGQLSESTEGGEFGEPCGVAVDGEGTVYVGDRGDDLIHVFDPAAAVPVNGDSAAESIATLSNPCSLAAGAAATEGFLFANQSSGSAHKLDATTGEVKYEIASSVNTLSVDPGNGHVFLARNCCSSSEVAEYDASGAAEASLVSAFKPGSSVEGVAVDSASNQVFVARGSTEEVEVFGAPAIVPDVVTEAPTSNTGTRATLAGTVNPDGVELDECFFEWGENVPGNAVYGNTAPCAETPAEIGAGTVPVAVEAEISGLTPQDSDYEYRLVAVNPNATINGSNQTFSTPDTVIAEAASGITPTEATLNGSVNPDTAALSECLFEWGPEKDVIDAFQAFPNEAPCVPGPGGITGESPVAVSAALSGLHPGTTYAYRLRVGYPSATIVNPGGSPLSVQTAGPAIEASWAQSVTRTEAALKAQINPEGSATTYRFEYGETAAYGSQTEELPVGSDSSTDEVSRFLDDLKPNTTYHWRAIATSGIAENVGPDQTLHTFAPTTPNTDCPNQEFRVGPSVGLADCRAYEMVSPVEKSSDIKPKIFGTGFVVGSEQAAIGGEKLAYPVEVPFGDAVSNLQPGTQYIASRNGNGWASHSISPPHLENVNPNADQLLPGRFMAFTPDLSIGFLWDDAKPPLTPDASTTSYNYYLRDNVNETYEAITTEFLSGFSRLAENATGLLLGYSGDGSHTLVQATAQLTPDAKAGSGPQVYDYHDGELELVSVLPGGEPAARASAGSAQRVSETAAATNVISDDGSRVFWTSYITNFSVTGRIYARIDGETTIPVSEPVSVDANATFEAASADGSTVLFSVEETLQHKGRLYRFDVDSALPTLIAGDIHTVDGVLGVSDDLSRVYFLSKEALTPGAVSGQPNLYLDDEGAKTFIATLAPQDETGFGGGIGGTATNGNAGAGTLYFDFSQVTGDGGHVIFQSIASLTGYDNTSVDNGEPAIEVFRYDADSAELICISCNPSGGRPQTDLLPRPHHNLGAAALSVQTAAWLPTPRRGSYTPRMVRADGNRVVFNAFDSLVPSDTNGVQDVYQWEAQGVGDCDQTEGCISLISTGENQVPSTFIDANGTGRDVFFRTAASIDPEDPGLLDIYDARVGGGFERPAPPPPCIGDSCQSPPPAPLDPSPASATFRGKGDPKPSSARNCRAQAKRAVKLSRRAKLLRRRAKKASAPRRAKTLRKGAVRFARKAKANSKRATRCRRANRRAGR